MKKYVNINSIDATVYEGHGKGGLVLFAHSFFGEQTEDGRFAAVAQSLSEKGVNCVTMDFPGFKDSEKNFRKFTLDACLLYLEECYAYMTSHYDIDKNKLALAGYSIGGKIIGLFYGRHREFGNLVFWAGACEQDEYFLGQSLREYKMKTDEKGLCDFFDAYHGCTYKMSETLVDNLLSYDALSCFQGFDGSALIIHGLKDETIDPACSRRLYESFASCTDKHLLMLEGADHGFGLWDGRTQDSEAIVGETVRFLSERML